ncbi:hypothetical protein BN961_01125 [Afipia felis]|uniref:Uncharacterized protein n=1 Tax=Afipia felis TaxID=1035 RepID=A0A090MPX6_AFIFE|nr:hypothetical protein BN961_01125 [Afipia felis]
MRTRIGFQPATHLETVDVGHHHVEQDDVAFGALADLKRLRAAIGGDHIEIFRREPCLQQLDVCWDVINDQNPRGHSKTP